MPSPVPKHLRTQDEIDTIAVDLLGHVDDLHVINTKPEKGTGVHRAKYAPGLATELIKFARGSIGDPMAGTGTLARETGLPVALNDIDLKMKVFLDPLTETGCEVSYGPAHLVPWKRDTCIFSPPYYPRTDRKKPNAHPVARGPIVGFRDSYDCDDPSMIGNPSGVNGILIYRNQMREVYRHLATVCSRMVVVTKNWTRLGVELRLDLDTILTAQEVGWVCVERHGWSPPMSLWSRYNNQRGGGVTVEDVLVFEKQN